MGIQCLKNFQQLIESVFADSDVLGYYIKNELGGKVPSKYQELQNRINIDKEPDDDDNDIKKINLLSEYLKNSLIYILVSLFLIM